jgi:nucleotide-binding universal stress UspA family protein
MSDTSAGIKQIVVGVDGSEQSNNALTWTIDLARALGAEVIAVFAVYIPPFAFAGYEPIPPPVFDIELREQLQRAFEEEWCAPLKASGLTYRTHFEEGRPSEVISDLADQLRADLIVVGRRGHGTVAELLLGSVSHELSHHATRPVVLISPPAGAESRSAQSRAAEASSR